MSEETKTKRTKKSANYVLQQVKDWTEVTRYLRGIDPFHRLVTIHPTGIGRLSARNAMDDLSLIDIEADNLVANFGKAQHERQTDIAQADYTDHCFARAQLLDEFFPHNRLIFVRVLSRP